MNPFARKPQQTENNPVQQAIAELEAMSPLLEQAADHYTKAINLLKGENGQQPTQQARKQSDEQEMETLLGGP